MKEEAKKIFLTSGALRRGHFMRQSGRHSDGLVQCSHLFENTQKGEEICVMLASLLKDVEADVVLGAAIGGILPAFLVARELSLPNVFCERKDGALLLRRGFRIPYGARVLIVEDEVTSGSSVREMIEMVLALGAKPVAVACLLDKSLGKAEFNMPFVSLLKEDIHSFRAEECPLCKEGVSLETMSDK